MTVTVQIQGEGLSFEGEVSKRIAIKMVELAMTNDQIPAEESPNDVEGGLPDSFFDRLSTKQEAFIRVLLAEDDWLGNEEIRNRMEAEHNVSTKGGQAIAGVRAGFTRKYGDDFDVVRRRWAGNENEYKLNDEYIEEIESGLEQLD